MLLAIATTHFDFQPTPRTHIYLGDGIDFLQQATTSYDAILLDVSMYAVVPSDFQTIRHCSGVSSALDAAWSGSDEYYRHFS